MSNLPATLIAAAGVISAVGALVAQWRHQNGPAHNPPAAPSDPAAPPAP